MADNPTQFDDGAPPESSELLSDMDHVSKDDSDDDDLESKKKILDQAKERFDLSLEAESEIRRVALEDLEFSTGKQWHDMDLQSRAQDGRPCLVINRIPQFIQQLTNDQRQNRPSIKVHPVDDGADVETARIIQGLIRHIEYNSNAEVAYDTAFESAARGGFGYWRVLTDFVDPTSFDQEIYIKRIRNPFAVSLDPSSQEPDGSDAEWGFIVDHLTQDEYRNKYPDSDLASIDAWQSLGNSAPSWVKDGSAAVAEYFYKDYKEETVHLLSTGESVMDSDLDKRLKEAASASLDVSVVQSRKTKIPMVKWCKLNGIEILEQGEWPGKYIPIVPVYGGELYVNGKKILEGIVRHAKDPQRMYNYWASAETEAIALAPRAPFVGAEGQFEGHEEKWKTANRKNHSYLEYKPTSLNGQPAPPPQRQAFEPAVQAITQARMMSADDLKATTGIYDASLGAQSPDSSGIAIQRRNQQSQTSNFHFMDNLTRSLKHTGRILVDVIPKIYDAARSSRIVGEDGTQEVVKLNQEFRDESGKPVIYRMDAGTYDVTVDVGPSFASKRQEAATSMMDLSRSYPQIMQIAGDLFVKNMDWPGAQEIADRIKKTLPPALKDPEKGQPQIPPQLQAQMQQMGQMIDSLTKDLKGAQEDLKMRKIEHDSRERIEMAKIQADIEMTMAKLGSQESIILLKQEISDLSGRLKLLGFYQQQPNPENSQSFAPPQSTGAMGADVNGGGMQVPTGGQPPGLPVEGNPNP